MKKQGIKFFERSRALMQDGNIESVNVLIDTITTLDVPENMQERFAPFLIDRNKFWRSYTNKSQITRLKFIIEFKQNVVFDRLYIQSNALYMGTEGISPSYESVLVEDLKGVTRTVGGLQEFQDVESVNGCFYLQFAQPVQLEATKTLQINFYDLPTNAQHFHVGKIIPTVELGTFKGFPKVSSIVHDYTGSQIQTLSGKVRAVKSNEFAAFNLDFSVYPVKEDLDLVDALSVREKSFLMWPCGGRYDEDEIRFIVKGYDVKDIYNVITTSGRNANYRSGILVNGVDQSISLQESI